MEFDRLVDNILTETIKPAMDRTREIYLLKINISDNPTTWHIDFRRLSEGGVSRLDSALVDDDPDFEVLYQGNNIQQVLQELKYSLKRYNQYTEILPNNIKQQIQDLFEGLKCTWSVIDRYYYTNSIFVYAEIDIPSIRANQINNDLQGVDTSGFEDLL
jgi:hypothetical protein